MVEHLFIALYIFTICFQIALWLILFWKISNKNAAAAPAFKDNLPSVTIVIAARNEENTIGNLLEALEKQEYKGELEIIVVNDRSTDKTPFIISSFSDKLPHLKEITIANLPKGKDGKKNALFIGTKQAKGEYLLLTDADCVPVSKQWVARMITKFSPSTDVVLGIGGYEKKPTLLNHVIQYETLITAIQYVGLAMLGFPYMGVGRNIAYRREAFLAYGFHRYFHWVGGDDDLMVNQLARKGNTAVAITPQSFTISEPKTTFLDWFQQKKRHLSAGKAYRLKNKLLLTTIGGSFLLSWIGLFGLLCSPFAFWGLSFFLVRIISVNLVLAFCAKKMNFPFSFLKALLLDFLYFMYWMVLGAISWFSKQKKWS